MKTRTVAGLGLSALMLGGATIGFTHAAIAATRSEAKVAKHAADQAAKAAKALGKGEVAKAVGFAEAAVALMPRDAGYRSLLGASYLKAGRFASAQATYADVLALSPNDGKAALNLALALIAQGQADDARRVLDDHAADMPMGDRGLAVALAGDPAGGVDILVAATRLPEANGKTRQNLALAMALAGRWREARAVIGVDMAPLEADARIVQWAAFAKPVRASDQVASLLGVTPASDPGRPVSLALNAPVPVAAPVADAPVAVAAAPIVPPVVVPTIDAAPVASPVVASGVRFAERSEVVQALPARRAPIIAAQGAFRTKLAAATPGPVKKAPVAAKPVAAPAKGNWYVQLGAFDSAAVAKDAWSRAQRRYAGFADQAPTGMAFKSTAGQFYRLSVGGFARGDADALCRGYRAKGGTCFVRAGAGDQVASWLKPARVQMASR